ncbi:hypothetical protein OY671_008728, partial [Metschnikowia pulcherrima]
MIGKGDQRSRDIPQSVSVVTRQRSDEQNSTSVYDASENTTGVTSQQSPQGGKYIYSRGFEDSVIQYDGVPSSRSFYAVGNSFTGSTAYSDRVEVFRGAQGSFEGAGQPGGVINSISKTGEQEGGAVQATVGLDYGEYRVDADYGGKISDSSRFHVGGFYRQGEVPRRAGYDGNRGGQIKFNVTKDFAGGYVRLYGKYSNDRAIGYSPNPVRVTGTSGDPVYDNSPGFSINGDTQHSRYLTR